MIGAKGGLIQTYGYYSEMLACVRADVAEWGDGVREFKYNVHSLAQAHNTAPKWARQFFGNVHSFVHACILLHAYVCVCAACVTRVRAFFHVVFECIHSPNDGNSFVVCVDKRTQTRNSTDANITVSNFDALGLSSI